MKNPPGGPEPSGSRFISIYLSDSELAEASKCKRTVSVCGPLMLEELQSGDARLLGLTQILCKTLPINGGQKLLIELERDQHICGMRHMPVAAFRGATAKRKSRMSHEAA
jgi:hypothetical protein